MIEIHDMMVRLGKFTLRDINLKIREGEYFVILGPTGAGKTVILEAIAGEIIREVPGVVSVTYNIASKPPSTIEAI